MMKEKIKKLWDWFKIYNQKIIDAIDNKNLSEQEYITEQLNNLVLDLGKFSWQIDKGTQKPWSFIISPNEDHELLKQTKKIIDQAPKLNKWEFHFCKPPQNWDYKIGLFDNFLIEREIDASDWKFAIRNDKNKQVTIILEIANMDNFDHETKISAANLAVINEIGEEVKIHKISNIKISDNLDAESYPKKLSIKELKKMF